MPETNDAIRDFKQLILLLKERNMSKRVAVIWPEDEHSQEAITYAADEGFVKPIFICSETTQKHFENKKGYEFIIASSPEDAARKGVTLVREGKADVIMKGFLNTDVLLKAILNKEEGILPKGTVLTHIAVAKIPNHHKLIFFTDAAVIPHPNDNQRREQVRYIVDFCHAFQIECPKVALIHCSEKVDERHFPYTGTFASLKTEAEEGVFGKCIVDGPLDLKTSCSEKALKVKQISSPLNGDADAIILPDIESGNLFYKAITLFCHAETAAILQGTLVPVVLPSRGDSIDSKFYSLALASLVSK